MSNVWDRTPDKAGFLLLWNKQVLLGAREMDAVRAAGGGWSLECGGAMLLPEKGFEMEETKDIAALMNSILAQEKAYEFDRIDEELAMQMGIYVIRRAKQIGKPVAVRVTLNRRHLFSMSMPGTKPECHDWMQRKENLVYKTNSSSYYWECWCEQGLHPFEWRGMNYQEYAPAGGSFPLRIKGADVVGTLTITGMASYEDHGLAFETVQKAIAGELDVDISGLL